MQTPLDEDLIESQVGGLGDLPADPEREAESAFMNKRLSKAFELLSRRERSVFMLRHYHDHKMREIGKILDLSAGTVKSLLFRAVKKMQKRLECFSDLM